MENIFYVVVLEWITLTVSIIRANLGMPVDLGEPKAAKAWLLAFLYMLLLALEFLCRVICKKYDSPLHTTL